MQSTTDHLKVPPFFFWAMAFLGWWGAARLFSLSSTAGSGLASLASIGTMIAAWIGGGMVLRALNDGDVRRDRRRLDRHRRRASQTHGRARLANRRDVKRFGLAKGRGVFLGRFRPRRGFPRDLYYSGENNVLTIGPAGSGKGTCAVIPNLITNRESMIVVDVKGELAAVTARHRHDELGHEIRLYNPFHETLSEELGVELCDDGFDPSALIRPGHTAKDDADLLASLALPMPAKPDPKSEFFLDAGQQYLSVAFLDLLRRGQPPTLPAARSWLMAMPRDLQDQLTDAAQSTAFGGAMRESAAKLLGTLTNAPEEFQACLSTAQKALRIYDSFGPLGEHVRRGTDHDFGDYKRRPITGYIILPSDRQATHAAYMNLVLSSAIELIARDRTNTRVTFLIDEFATIGHLPNLLRAMGQYRAQGIRFHAVIQQVSQIRRLYGNDGWRDMAGLCDVIQAFGVTEYETCKLLSDMTGHATVEDVSQNVRPKVSQDISHAELSYGQTRSGQPLLRPEDIRTLPSRRQLIFYRNMPPLLAGKVDYRDRRRWRRCVDPNPYYQRPDTGNPTPDPEHLR